MAKPSSEQILILFSLWLLVFSASSQVMIIAPLIPAIAKELGSPVEDLGNLITIYASFLGVFALIMGPVSDKIGRRKILLIGSSFMSLFLLMHFFINDFYQLMILRGLAGAAGGVLSGSAVSYVGDYFPYNKRGWANGWVMSGVAMGQILGIPMGTFLADTLGFKFPFLVFGIIMACTFLLMFFRLPQPKVVLQKDEVSVKSSFIKYKTLLSRSDIQAVSISYVLMFFSLSVFIIYFPAWLEKIFSISSSDIGLLFLAGGISNALTGPFAGKISDTIGRKNMILLSCLGLSVIFILTTYLIQDYWVTFILFPIAMAFIAIRISPFQALSSELVNSDNRGSLMSMLVAIGNIGTGFAGFSSGLIFAQYDFFGNTVIATISIIVTAMIVWLFVPEPELNISHSQKTVEIAE